MNNSQLPGNTYTFSSVSDAIFTANYVDQLLASEHQWITSRLSWLFISQSFCLTAYVILVTSTAFRNGAFQQLMILQTAVPVIGIISALAVGIATIAATTIAGRLTNERARLCQYINAHTGTTIPLIGVDPTLRQKDIQWTIWGGGLPGLLPWPLMVLWVMLLVG